MALRKTLSSFARTLSLGDTSPQLSAFLLVPNSAWLSCLRHLSAASQQSLLVVHSRVQPDAHLQEALRLAETFSGSSCPHEVVGPAKNFQISPSTYFGSGTVSELADKSAQLGIDKVFMNVELSGVQQRNLEAALGRPVIDRMNIIIDIFGQRARTREAKLQVEMAALELRASRLVRARDAASGQRTGFGEQGASSVVSARERGRSSSSSGGLGGGGGAGESELQLQRSRLRTRIRALKSQLADVRRSRAVQRSARSRSSTPTVAVVGYTNAGKSSLVSRWARCDIAVRDRLFETLDTTTRRVNLPSGRQAVFTDTVGFISDLPTQLIDAFRATLEEVREADLLLHVLDASSPAVEQQRLAVLDVLRHLGFSQLDLRERVIEVWNKADLLNLPLHVKEASDWDEPALTSFLKAGTDRLAAGGAAQGTARSENGDDGIAAAACQRQEPVMRQANVAVDGKAAQQAQQGAQDGLKLAESVNSADMLSAPQRAADGDQSGQHDEPAPEDSSAAAGIDVDNMAQAVAERYEPQALSSEEKDATQHDLTALSAPQPAQHAAQAAPSSAASALEWDSSDVDEQEAAAVQQGMSVRTREEIEAWMGKRLASRAACPNVATTSVKTGYGLQSLLEEVDRKVAVKCATREVQEGLARMGPRMLLENLVGPVHSRSMLRHMSKQTGTPTGQLARSPAQRRRTLAQQAWRWS